MDLRQHRAHEAADAGDGAGDRLVARNDRLQARVLPLEPVDVPEDAGERHRLQEDRHRQLGPGGPDRAGQRAGDRRPRLALRRADRKARNPDVLRQDHRLRRGTAGSRRAQAARLAGARAPDAGQLDRQIDRGALRLPARDQGRRRRPDQRRQAVGVYHARRHHQGRHLLRGGAGTRTGQPLPRSRTRNWPPSSPNARKAA